MGHLCVPVAERTAEANTTAGRPLPVTTWWMSGIFASCLAVRRVNIARQRRCRNADDAEICLCNRAILRTGHGSRGTAARRKERFLRCRLIECVSGCQ